MICVKKISKNLVISRKIVSEEDVNEESIHGIPRDVMIAAAEYSLREARAGRCIPNSEVESYIAKKREWK